MKFITIGQYFYTLYSVLLLILLLPIFCFIISYSFLPRESFAAPPPTLLAGFAAIIACDWLISFILFNKKIKTVRNHQGLRLKLEKYFYITIVRYIVIASGCFVLACGFYYYGADFFTACFAGNLLLLGLLWPTPAKVCNDLKLRGDEREMVYYKKDVL